MNNSNQKKIFIITILFLSISSGYAQLDTRTQNQIKAKFLNAQEYYDDGNYSESLEKVSEIEALTGGQLLAAAQNLKVKCLVGQGKYIKAKDELYILEGLNLSTDLLKDIAEYGLKIEKHFEVEKKLKEQKQALVEKANFDKGDGTYAFVRDENWLKGMIDSDGNIIVEFKYERTQTFGEYTIAEKPDESQDLYKGKNLILSNSYLSFAWDNALNVSDIDFEFYGLYSLKLGEWILKPTNYQKRSNSYLVDDIYIKYYESREHSEEPWQERKHSLLNVSNYL